MKLIESICRHDGRFVASAPALLLTAGYVADRGFSGILREKKERERKMFYRSVTGREERNRWTKPKPHNNVNLNLNEVWNCKVHLHLHFTYRESLWC